MCASIEIVFIRNFHRVTPIDKLNRMPAFRHWKRSKLLFKLVG